MKQIVGYLKEYIRSLDKRVFGCCTLFITALIFLNYQNNLTKEFTGSSIKSWSQWSLLFLITFSSGYLIIELFERKRYFNDKAFLLLLVIAPMIFAWKMIYHFHFIFDVDRSINNYWNSIVYYPLKFVIIATVLYVVWKRNRQPERFYGLTVRDVNLSPYLLMLLIMLPLIAFASTQPDFLHQYPRYQSNAFLREAGTGWYQLLYALSYGTDFLTIELFFRGFLILAFVKYAGKDAILPMAMFYCTIHFGKPLGECISSYFGGIILGTVIYHTRTIVGGLIVHLGIAWMMEVGGYLGHLYFK